MDKFSLLDILAVGIPETVLTLIILLYSFEENFKLNKKNIFRLAISTIGVLGFIYYSRLNLNSITYIACISSIAYIVVFKFLYGYNLGYTWLKSTLMGLLAVYSVITIELLSYPVYALINQYAYGEFFANRFIYSIPSRFIQIILLFAIIRYKLQIKDFEAIEKPWRELSKSNKITAVILITLISMGMVFNFSYSDMFIKIQVNKPNIPYLNVNLKLYFVQTLLFALVTLVVFFRTYNSELYKKTLAKSVKTIELQEERIKELEELQVVNEKKCM